MIIGICGKSGTGKSTIAKELEKRGYQKIITDTTRPKRKGEENGVDYWFDTDEEFDEFLREGEFIETTSYKVANGETWRYGTTIGQYNEVKGNGVIVLNPSGVKAFKEKGLEIKIFLIETEEPEILSRLRKRGDNWKEVLRRMKADAEDFKNIRNYIDYAVYNNSNTNIKDLTDTIINLAKVRDLVEETK